MSIDKLLKNIDHANLDTLQDTRNQFVRRNPGNLTPKKKRILEQLDQAIHDKVSQQVEATRDCTGDCLQHRQNLPTEAVEGIVLPPELKECRHRLSCPTPPEKMTMHEAEKFYWNALEDLRRHLVSLQSGKEIEDCIFTLKKKGMLNWIEADKKTTGKGMKAKTLVHKMPPIVFTPSERLDIAGNRDGIFESGSGMTVLFPDAIDSKWAGIFFAQIIHYTITIHNHFERAEAAKRKGKQNSNTVLKLHIDSEKHVIEERKNMLTEASARGLYDALNTGITLSEGIEDSYGKACLNFLEKIEAKESADIAYAFLNSEFREDIVALNQHISPHHSQSLREGISRYQFLLTHLLILELSHRKDNEKTEKVIGEENNEDNTSNKNSSAAKNNIPIPLQQNPFYQEAARQLAVYEQERIRAFKSTISTKHEDQFEVYVPALSQNPALLQEVLLVQEGENVHILGTPETIAKVATATLVQNDTQAHNRICYYLSLSPEAELASLTVPSLQKREAELIRTQVSDTKLLIEEERESPNGQAHSNGNGHAVHIPEEKQSLPRFRTLRNLLLNMGLKATVTKDAPGEVRNETTTGIAEGHYAVVTVPEANLQIILSDDRDKRTYIVYRQNDPETYANTTVKELREIHGATAVQWHDRKQWLHAIQNTIEQQRTNPKTVYPLNSDGVESPFKNYPNTNAVRALQQDLQVIADRAENRKTSQDLTMQDLRGIQSGDMLWCYGGPACGNIFLDRLARGPLRQVLGLTEENLQPVYTHRPAALRRILSDIAELEKEENGASDQQENSNS